MRALVEGRLRNTRLPRSKPLLPVFEAVMNGFQAIEETERADGEIEVILEREPTTDDTRPAAVAAVTVVDNGVGFTAENLEAFNTVDTLRRAAAGGKGLGRFLWLKAFGRAEIDSRFRDNGELYSRRFTFEQSSNDLIAEARPCKGADTGTRVRLVPLRSPFDQLMPKGLQGIAERLIEHFLPLFLAPNCPRVTVRDESDRISLNAYFSEHYRASASTHSFVVAGESFEMNGFRLHRTDVSQHRLVYGAHFREVREERLDRHLPNLHGRLEDGERGAFYYLGFVQGEYLDSHVSSERTAFAIPDEPLADGEAGTTIPEEVTFRELRKHALNAVQADLGSLLQEINEAKRERIEEFIDQEAPQYRPLKKCLAEFIDTIPPTASRTAMDTALHQELSRRERELRSEGRSIIEAAANVTDYEEYAERLRSFVGRFNEIGKSALAQYVAHRKIILELLEKALSRDESTGTYPLEEVVHSLVFPMRATSDDVPFDQQNLWIIDERLSYHSFLASDKELRSAGSIDSRSKLRPDLLIFDRSLVFSDSDQPLTAAVIVEFKRPDRTDFRDDPIEQVFDVVRELRASKLKDSRGRLLRPANDKIPAYCYIVADLTESLEKKVQNAGGFRTPDNLGYYGFNSHLFAYFEVISYSKLLGDARKRNRVLFEKLGIAG